MSTNEFLPTPWVRKIFTHAITIVLFAFVIVLAVNIYGARQAMGNIKSTYDDPSFGDE